MKNLITLITLLLAPVLLLAQTDCKPFVPLKKGAKWELTNYTQKGKETGKTAYELVDVVESGSNTTFTIKTTSFDKKGKETYTNQFEAYCKDGKFEFDMAFKINAESMQSYQNMDVSVDASEYVIPSLEAAPGTTLPDGNLKVTVAGGGPLNINITVEVTDRKVEAKEEIKTPAGTFSCIKLSQTISTKTIMKVQGSSTEWYAEGIGLVRSESYNKAGKLMGYSELTKLEK